MNLGNKLKTKQTEILDRININREQEPQFVSEEKQKLLFQIHDANMDNCNFKLRH